MNRHLQLIFTALDICFTKLTYEQRGMSKEKIEECFRDGKECIKSLHDEICAINKENEELKKEIERLKTKS